MKYAIDWIREAHAVLRVALRARPSEAFPHGNPAILTDAWAKRVETLLGKAPGARYNESGASDSSDT